LASALLTTLEEAATPGVKLAFVMMIMVGVLILLCVALVSRENYDGSQVAGHAGGGIDDIVAPDCCLSATSLYPYSTTML